ncbi:hypothetical protein BsWGS_13302 [Bradybaena similaris]
MEAPLLALLVMTAGATSSPTDRDARATPKSLTRLVKDAMGLALEEANIMYTQCAADAFVGLGSGQNQSVVDVLAPLPCNCVCYVCWKAPLEDLIAQCEDHCEASCRWNFKRHPGVSRGGRKRDFNLVEACIGFGGSLSTGGGSDGGLLGGVLGGANRSETKLNDAVVEDKNGQALLLDKDKPANNLPDTGNGSVGSIYGDLNNKPREGHAGSDKIIVDPSDANIGQGHVDGPLGNSRENSGTNVPEINIGFLGGSTAETDGFLTSGFLGNGFQEKPLENKGAGSTSVKFEEYPKNYSTLMVSVQVSPCNKSKCPVNGLIRDFPGNRTTQKLGGQHVNYPGSNTDRLSNEFHGQLENVSGSCHGADLGLSRESVKGGMTPADAHRL